MTLLCPWIEVMFSGGVVERPADHRTVSAFLHSAAQQPSQLVIEGEAGIGKTTLWFAALEEARELGFQVFTARGGEADTVLAYAAVAGLLGDVDPAVLEELPEVQRIAVDRVSLRASGDGPSTDQGVVATALVTVINRLASDSPVLLAIDDVQWLDPSSRAVIALAARRLAGRVGLLVTERTEHAQGDAGTWLQLANSEAITRLRLGPLSQGVLHALISARLGRSLPRPAVVRIAEVSRGNPFYALELARAMEAGVSSARAVLPATLAELMRQRIGRLEKDTQGLLLAAACAAAPTVDLLASVTGTTIGRTAELLAEANRRGIIEVDGDLVHFTHPMLARSVYTDARPSERRAMHRSLAHVETQPELRARHMALATTSADPAALEALDAAADSARSRGAPAAAAELVELAISLGGDTPIRRIGAAEHHMRAGDLERAHGLLSEVISRVPTGVQRSMALNLLATMQIHRNSVARAIELLLEAFNNAGDNREVQVRTLLLLAFAKLSAGELVEALDNADWAVSFAGVVENPDLTSQVLSMREMVACISGHGVDENRVEQSLALESPDSDAPIALRASANYAVLMAYVGRLDDASKQMSVVRRRCADRGAETDLIFVSFFSTLIAIWQGDFRDAATLVQETVERAEQLGGEHPRVVALTAQALIASYLGEPEQTRENALAAIDLARRCGSPRLSDWGSISLGFLEVSLGNYTDALTVLQPLIARFNFVPGTEIMTTAYLPDAVRALIATGNDEAAEPMVDALEANGRRLDRPWMLAMAARCRSWLLAARGDIAGAVEKAEEALSEHERLPMPFERARTLVLLGQLQRRQRQKETAAATLTEALQVFEAMGTKLWIERAQAELSRVNVAPNAGATLTPSERRCAELAASGMTTREIAAALLISPKTVETNLARVYRKLDVKTRAELGRVIDM